jgi:hypothetical protein
LPDIGGYESLSPGAYHRLFNAINGGSDNYMIVSLDKAPGLNRGLADLLGVRCFYSSPGSPLPPFTRPLAESDLALGVNPTALPRVFFVDRAEVLGSEDEVLARMVRADFDPRSAVLLSASAPVPEASGRSDGGPSARIAVSRPRPEHFVIDASVPRAGYLVVTETRYPGWRALLDGHDALLETAYATFDAVAVPAGRHRLELVYAPLAERVGRDISAATWTILLVLALGTGPARKAEPRPG